MDLGPDCDYGMAYQISGKPQKKPGVFQCNIGLPYPFLPISQWVACRYIADHSEPDFFATAGSTFKMMKSLLDDPEAGNDGFVSDIVAQFNLEEARFSNYSLSSDLFFPSPSPLISSLPPPSLLAMVINWDDIQFVK